MLRGLVMVIHSTVSNKERVVADGVRCTAAAWASLPSWAPDDHTPACARAVQGTRPQGQGLAHRTRARCDGGATDGSPPPTAAPCAVRLDDTGWASKGWPYTGPSRIVIKKKII